MTFKDLGEAFSIQKRLETINVRDLFEDPIKRKQLVDQELRRKYYDILKYEQQDMKATIDYAVRWKYGIYALGGVAVVLSALGSIPVSVPFLAVVVPEIASKVEDVIVTGKPIYKALVEASVRVSVYYYFSSYYLSQGALATLNRIHFNNFFSSLLGSATSQVLSTKMVSNQCQLF